jgi:hypothetical protein
VCVVGLRDSGSSYRAVIGAKAAERLPELCGGAELARAAIRLGSGWLQSGEVRSRGIAALNKGGVRDFGVRAEGKGAEISARSAASVSVRRTEEGDDRWARAVSE